MPPKTPIISKKTSATCFDPTALSLPSPGVHDTLLTSLEENSNSNPSRPQWGINSDQLNSAEDSSPTPRQGKLVLDRVYEHVFLPNFAIAIIDTPEFQRLRSLQQLGVTSYLYPGATHTRFEHSIGVAHLASLMLKKIARRQPQFRVTEADVLCVTAAGLCHDLGHGPFSHLFEEIVNKERDAHSLPRWHHEDMSVILLRRVLGRISLEDYGLTPQDGAFIELCITGLPGGQPWPGEAVVGRGPEKRFILDIVANKRNGIDVDKLDYFMRDSLCCYGRSSVECSIPRLVSSCRALSFAGEYQICFEEKMALSLGDIFTLRAKLHKYAYQHRIVKVLDHMISDVLAAADPYFTVPGEGGVLRRISECVEDPAAFIRLGDWILRAIESNSDPRLAESQRIISRINERNLYAVAGTATYSNYLSTLTKSQVREQLLEEIRADNGALIQEVHRESIAAEKRQKLRMQQQASMSVDVSPQRGRDGEPMLKLSRIEPPQMGGIPTTSTHTPPPSSPTSPSHMDDDSLFLSEGEVATTLQEVAADIIVDYIKIHYGSSDSEGHPDDPINHVAFYNPKASRTAFHLPRDRISPLFSPRQFGEKTLVVVLREHRHFALVLKAFQRWKERNSSQFINAVPVSNPMTTTTSRARRSHTVTPRKAALSNSNNL